MKYYNSKLFMIIVRITFFLLLLLWVFVKTNRLQILIRINRFFIWVSLKRLLLARKHYNHYLVTQLPSYLQLCHQFLALMNASITNRITTINGTISDDPHLKDASVRHYVRELERINSEIAHIQYLGNQYRIFIQKNIINKTTP